MFANEVSQILFSVRNRIQYTPNNYLNVFSRVWTPTFASRAVILPRTIKILGGRCCFITTDFINSKKEVLILLNESNSFFKSPILFTNWQIYLYLSLLHRNGGDGQKVKFYLSDPAWRGTLWFHTDGHLRVKVTSSGLSDELPAINTYISAA